MTSYSVVSQSRWSPPDILSVLRRILTGKPYSLELYKSLKQKQELLRAAINLGDGDAILTVGIISLELTFEVFLLA